LLALPPPPRPTLFPYTTLFRSRGGTELAEIGAFIVERIVRAHLDTMARLNVSYDLLTYEGDILRLHFWALAFDILKKSGAVFLRSEEHTSELQSLAYLVCRLLL